MTLQSLTEPWMDSQFLLAIASAEARSNPDQDTELLTSPLLSQRHNTVTSPASLIIAFAAPYRQDCHFLSLGKLLMK